jgi:hypothetical protein
MDRLPVDLNPPAPYGEPAFVFLLMHEYELRGSIPLVKEVTEHFPMGRVHAVLGPDTEHGKKLLGPLAGKVILHDSLGWSGEVPSPAIHITIPLYQGNMGDRDFVGGKTGANYYLNVNPEKVKFDVNTPVSPEKRDEYRRIMGIADRHFVVVAGSLEGPRHYPGCGCIGVKDWSLVHRDLVKDNPGQDIISVVAPRNFKESKGLIAGLSEPDTLFTLSELRSAKRIPPERGSYVVVVDTMGELPELYSIAHAAFVDGSHNILEPAEQAKPVLFMADNSNFPLSLRGLEGCGGGFPIESPLALSAILGCFANDPDYAVETGLKAKRFKGEHAGISGRLVARLQEIAGACTLQEPPRRALRT